MCILSRDIIAEGDTSTQVGRGWPKVSGSFVAKAALEGHPIVSLRFTEWGVYPSPPGAGEFHVPCCAPFCLDAHETRYLPAKSQIHPTYSGPRPWLHLGRSTHTSSRHRGQHRRVQRSQHTAAAAVAFPGVAPVGL